MFFRPLPRFTAFCLPLFLALIALGIWQLERLHWKLGLIAEMKAHLHTAPVSPDTLRRLPGDSAQYRRVALSGHFASGKVAYFYTTAPDGTPVYHAIEPFELDNGEVMLVDRGWLPFQMRDLPLPDSHHVVGIWRMPDAPGLFTPPPDLAHHVWYARDLAGIAKALAVKPAAPAILEADAMPNPGGWPKGGQTVVVLRNDHLEYAITWFLLAAGLVVVYLAYHQARGRLGLRP